MPGQFSITWPNRRGPSDPWFRVGSVDITTSTFVAALSVVSFFVYAIDIALLRWLQFWPTKVVNGQIWRLATWPLLNEPGVWTAFSVFLLWWFGNQLELDFGRVRFTRFLIAVTVVPAVITTGYYYLSGGATSYNIGSLLVVNGQAIRMVELAVFVAYVAEHAHAKFFFGIPAWVLGVVILGVDVLQFLGDRLFLALAFELTTAGVALLLLRAFGFGHAVSWVPLLPLPKSLVGPGGVRTRRPKVKPAKRAANKPARRKAKGPGATVVGPWPGSAGGSGGASQHEVDRILDKIAASGMDSLTAEERAQLEAASRARRDKKS